MKLKLYLNQDNTAEEKEPCNHTASFLTKTTSVTRDTLTPVGQEH